MVLFYTFKFSIEFISGLHAVTNSHNSTQNQNQNQNQISDPNKPRHDIISSVNYLVSEKILSKFSTRNSQKFGGTFWYYIWPPLQGDCFTIFTNRKSWSERDKRARCLVFLGDIYQGYHSQWILRFSYVLNVLFLSPLYLALSMAHHMGFTS